MNANNQFVTNNSEEIVMSHAYSVINFDEETQLLMSIEELDNFDHYIKTSDSSEDGITVDTESYKTDDYALVYGSILYLHKDEDNVPDWVNGVKGTPLINTDSKTPDNLIASSYDDIKMITDIDFRRPNSIPFIALMRTRCKTNNLVATTLVPYEPSMGIWYNFAGRPFTLACRKFEYIPGINPTNWESHIDMDKVKAAAILSFFKLDASPYFEEIENKAC